MSNIDTTDAARGIKEFRAVFTQTHSELTGRLDDWFQEIEMMLRVYTEPPVEEMAQWLSDGEGIMDEILRVLTTTRTQLLTKYNQDKAMLRMIDHINGKTAQDFESVENQYLRALWRVVDMTYDLLGCKERYKSDRNRWYMQLVHDTVYLAQQDEVRKLRFKGQPRNYQTAKVTSRNHRKSIFDTCKSLDTLKARAE